MAQLHHFEDAPSEVYFNSYWSKAEVTHLLEEIGATGWGLPALPTAAPSSTPGKGLGWSRSTCGISPLSPPGEAPPRFTIEQATRIICEALSPLGDEYGRELASLLDPANGRMDILPGDHRKAGGFSKGFPGVTTVFFSHGFEGLLQRYACADARIDPRHPPPIDEQPRCPGDVCRRTALSV